MSETEFCRLCSNLTNSSYAVELFDRSRRKLLRQIEELIGQRLKNLEHLPQLICEKCQNQTLQAHLFRKCCIQAQKHFATAAYKTQMKAHHGSTNETEKTTTQDEPKLEPLPIEEVVMDVKVEEEAVMQVYNEMPLSNKGEDVLLKHEFPPTENTEDCSSNDGSTASPKDYHDTNEVHLDKLSCSMTVDEMKATSDEESFSSDASSEHKPIRLHRVGRPRGTKNKMHNSDDKKIGRNRKRRSNAKKRDYICDQCGTHFSNLTIFTTHLRRHAGEKPFQCEICPDKFLSQAQLSRHVRKHTGEKPYPCRHCERRFLDLSARLRHERVHNNERPFACQECGKAFTVGHTLKEHMRIHTGERPFTCKICSVSFTIKAHLKTHCRSMTHKQNEEKQLNLPSKNSDAAAVPQITNNSDWPLD